MKRLLLVFFSNLKKFRCAGLLILVLLTYSKGYSQASIADWQDSIRVCFKHKPSLLFGFDGRRSFYENKPVRVSGLRVGIEYYNKLRFYVGYYSADPVEGTLIVNRMTPDEDTLLTRGYFSYFQIGSEYVFHDTRRWQWTLPVQIGYGFGTRERFSKDSSYYQQRQTRFIPVEVTINGTFKIFYWLGIGGGFSYRFNLFPVNGTASGAFSSPLYTVGVRFSFGKFARAVWKGKPIFRCDPY